MKALTQTEYAMWQKAYDFFNRELFADALPPVLITLNAHRRDVRGHFGMDMFTSRVDGKRTVSELALNPMTFGDRTDEEILSTMVHEMTHAQQALQGRPGRRGYHNTEWGTFMKAVGLYPSRTGEKGGEETGETCSHYVVKDGPYQQAYRKLRKTGFRLNWQSGAFGKGGGVGGKQPSKGTRVKYVCAECELAAWAKPAANLVCGDCGEAMEAVD